MRTATVRRLRNGSQPGQSAGAGRQDPTGPPREVEEKAGIGDRIGAADHDRLIAQNLAVAVEPDEQPADQGWKKSGTRTSSCTSLAEFSCRARGANSCKRQARRCDSGQVSQSGGTRTRGRKPPSVTGEATAG